MRLLRPFCALVASALLAPIAAANSDDDLVTPTSWVWLANTSLQSVEDRVAQGFRIVDIEIENESPLRLCASMVRNTGDYAKSWWWYHGLTVSDVNSRVSANQARLVDVEPYETAAGIRYAVVMIANTGTDFATGHGWQTNHTFATLSDWLQQNPTRRIVDIQPYRNGGNLRYAFVWVANSGNTQSASWIYLNTSQAFISDRLAANQARLIDLEPHDDTDTYSAIMVPLDGNLFSWFYNVPFDDIGRLAGQYATRITDIERYRTSTGHTLYALVCRRNDNDLAVQAAFAMRQGLNISATSGLMLREYEGTPSTLAGVFENRIFEPASLINTVHHFVANRRVVQGLDSFGSLMTVNEGLNGSCPTGSNPTIRTLGTVLERMMENSSNTATEAIRSRYGTNTIESFAGLFGATNVALNHTIGCFCGQTRNELTLNDLAELHGVVIGGALGSIAEDFYERMSNGRNFGMGNTNTETILNDELNASSLSLNERTAFLASSYFAHKGGSYTCTSGGVTEAHRSRGAYVRLPERDGCQTILREYFIGAWVNDAPTGEAANNSVGAGLGVLFRNRVRAAIQTWESANCNPFVNYCTATINSSGQRGRCSAAGNAFILSNNLLLIGSQLPGGSFASVIFGNLRFFVANPGGSAGNLCVGGNVGRLYASLGTTSPNGVISYQPDLTDLRTSLGTPISLQPGDRLMFQWWTRDMGPSGPTSNFTDALEVTFL